MSNSTNMSFIPEAAYLDVKTSSSNLNLNKPLSRKVLKTILYSRGLAQQSDGQSARSLKQAVSMNFVAVQAGNCPSRCMRMDHAAVRQSGWSKAEF